MELFLAIVLGLLIGGILGGLGGGGAILTVPALVYVLGEPARDATTASLVIVGLSALAGVASYVVSKRVSWRTAIVFGVVGFPAAWVGSALNHHVNEDILLLGFAVLMIAAAAAMTGRRRSPGGTADPGHDGGARGRPDNVMTGQATGTNGARIGSATTVTAQTPPSPAVPTSPAAAATDSAAVALAGERGLGARRPRLVVVVLAALVVGLLTGFFGVGGGFVIVPALVLVLGLPMQQAVGTSLLIVAINSASSLASRAGTAHFDWSVIVPFTAAATVATLLGKRAADRLPHHKLTRGFAALLVVVALYTAVQSLMGLL